MPWYWRMKRKLRELKRIIRVSITTLPKGRLR
jgi:hypothetical protein